jgi:glycosyltransferase involved in cell wall biosynthesis
MPLYNTESYVGQAIQSLLSQTYRDFELIIVNDASTDTSLEIVKTFNDTRLRILNNKKNSGIVFSRNKGLREAKGEFIAPFDSDDLAVNDKFEKQIGYLKKHKELGMIGSWARMIDENGLLLKNKWKLSASPEQIPAIMLFRNYFVQSSVVIRREAVPVGGYSPGFDVVEDYKMWTEVLRICKAWNLPEYLVHYRIHREGATQRDAEGLFKKEAELLKLIYEPLGMKINDSLAKLILLIRNSDAITNKETLDEVEDFLSILNKQNAKLSVINQKQLNKAIFNRWIKACSKGRFDYIWLAKKILTSDLSRYYF